ncbi:MAG: hypothetical protein AVDCRST_MAG49-4098, partial [uncultured Thermomicrobiales bacterium]
GGRVPWRRGGTGVDRDRYGQGDPWGGADWRHRREGVDRRHRRGEGDPRHRRCGRRGDRGNGSGPPGGAGGRQGRPV